MSEHKQKDDRLNAIEARLALLEDVIDTNSGVFRDSFELAELCIQALQRAMDGLLLGDVYLVNVEGAKRVDFKRYLKEAMEQRAASDKAKNVPVEETPAFEFGG